MISLRGSYDWTYSGTNSFTVILPTHQAGDLLLVRTARKPWNSGPYLDTAAVTDGWKQVNTAWRDGTAASFDGQGSVVVKAFWKVATSASTTNPAMWWSYTPAPGMWSSLAYSKGPGEQWITPIGWGGGMPTASTSFSATIVQHYPSETGDVLDFFVGITDSVSFSTRPTVTQAGATIGSATYAPASDYSTTSNNNGSASGGYCRVTAGTSSAAAVVAATLSQSETGTAWVTRLRVGHSSEVAKFAIGSGGFTPLVRTDHGIGVRARVTGGGGAVAAALYQGSTNISGDVIQELTSSYREYRLAFPDALLSQIADYTSGLELRVWFLGIIGRLIDIDWLRLWAPFNTKEFRVGSLILAPRSSSFAASAIIPCDIAWTTPVDDVDISASPTLAFRMAFPHISNMHFEMQLDTESGFTDPLTFRTMDDPTGWEYWDGNAWQPIPITGVPNTFPGGAEARYTLQSPLTSGQRYFRRVRAGKI